MFLRCCIGRVFGHSRCHVGLAHGLDLHDVVALASLVEAHPDEVQELHQLKGLQDLQELVEVHEVAEDDRHGALVLAQGAAHLQVAGSFGNVFADLHEDMVHHLLWEHALEDKHGLVLGTPDGVQDDKVLAHDHLQLVGVVGGQARYAQRQDKVLHCRRYALTYCGQPAVQDNSARKEPVAQEYQRHVDKQHQEHEGEADAGAGDDEDGQVGVHQDALVLRQDVVEVLGDDGHYHQGAYDALGMALEATHAHD
mmetsp:Transcript_32542/g.89769  ORF Transcript_32542/g.89769 Transcript_32542/m.89769 type:complete len:253 (+) Transcript_32542:2298-3056(+)